MPTQNTLGFQVLHSAFTCARLTEWHQLPGPQVSQETPSHPPWGLAAPPASTLLLHRPEGWLGYERGWELGLWTPWMLTGMLTGIGCLRKQQSSHMREVAQVKPNLAWPPSKPRL